MMHRDEYERLPEKTSRESEQGSNLCPLGKPEEYEDDAAYKFHRMLVAREKYRGRSH